MIEIQIRHETRREEKRREAGQLETGRSLLSEAPIANLTEMRWFTLWPVAEERTSGIGNWITMMMATLRLLPSSQPPIGLLAGFWRAPARHVTGIGLEFVCRLSRELAQSESCSRPAVEAKHVNIVQSRRPTHCLNSASSRSKLLQLAWPKASKRDEWEQLNRDRKRASKSWIKRA